jgi:hypothetical protein
LFFFCNTNSINACLCFMINTLKYKKLSIESRLVNPSIYEYYILIFAIVSVHFFWLIEKVVYTGASCIRFVLYFQSVLIFLQKHEKGFLIKLLLLDKFIVSLCITFIIRCIIWIYSIFFSCFCYFLFLFIRLDWYITFVVEFMSIIIISFRRLNYTVIFQL